MSETEHTRQGHHVELEMHPLDGHDIKKLSEAFAKHTGTLTIDGHDMTVLDDVRAELASEQPGLVFVTMTIVATSGKLSSPGQPDVTWGERP